MTRTEGGGGEWVLENLTRVDVWIDGAGRVYEDRPSPAGIVGPRDGVADVGSRVHATDCVVRTCLDGFPVSLVPFERRCVRTCDEDATFLRNVAASDQVRVRPLAVSGVMSSGWWSLLNFVLEAVVVVSIGILLIVLGGGDVYRPLFVLAIAGIALPFAGLYAVARARGEEHLASFRHGASLAAVVGVAVVALPTTVGWATDFTFYDATHVDDSVYVTVDDRLVHLTDAGYLAIDGDDSPVFVVDDGRAVVDDGRVVFEIAGDGPVVFATRDDHLVYMWARFVQMGAITAVTLLPAMMFYMFDRRRGPVIRSRMVQALFRLEKRFETLRDVEAAYGEQLDELGGPSSVPGLARRTRHRSIVVVATVFIGGGWLLALTNADVAFQPGRSFSAYLQDLLTPEPTLYAYAFLGAYLFTILLVLRSYLRSDLQPKTYGLISARVAVVLVLGLLLPKVYDSDAAWVSVAAFLVGVVPSEFLRMIGNMVTASSRAAGRRVDFDGLLHEREPLTSIHGIDLYDQTRLEMEGINNVEALAHGDLVELMFETRIPPERIVDWVDQAVLAVRIPPVHVKRKEAVAPPGSADLRKNLQYYGVRTATDLDGSRNTVTALLKDDEDRIESIVDTMRDEEWMVQLRHWRESDAMSVARPRPAKGEARGDRRVLHSDASDLRVGAGDVSADRELAAAGPQR